MTERRCHAWPAVRRNGQSVVRRHFGLAVRRNGWFAAPWIAGACFVAAACGAGAGAGDRVLVAEVAYEMPVLEEVTRIRKLVRVEETGEFWNFNSGEPHFIKADSAGRVLAAFGERGEGPDEIGYPAAIVGAGADWVEPVDSPREAWRRFDLTGKEIASTPLPGTQRLRVVVDLELTSYGDQYQSYFDGDRFIFPNFPRGLENTQHFWRTRLDQVDRRSGQMSTIFDFWTWHADHREQLQSARALAPIPLWSVCPDGAVAVYRPFADSLRVLGKSEASAAVPRAPERLRDGDAIGFVRGLIDLQVSAGTIAPEDAESVTNMVVRESKAQGDFGPFAPAYIRMHGDHRRRFWLQRFSTEDHFLGFGDTWDVLSPEGEHLGAVRFPSRFRPMIFEDDGIWGVREDSLDVNQVVKVAYPRGL